MPTMSIKPRVITVHDSRGSPVDIGIANRLWAPDIGHSQSHYYSSIRTDRFGSRYSAHSNSFRVREHFLWTPGSEVAVEFPLPYEKQKNPF